MAITHGKQLLFYCLILACLLQSVWAIKITNQGFSSITTGSKITLNWRNAKGPVYVSLVEGDSGSHRFVLQLGGTSPKPSFGRVLMVMIKFRYNADQCTGASGELGNYYAWTVPRHIKSGIYAFQVHDSTGGKDYSPEFRIKSAGLSKGTKAGIGVGASFGTLAIVCALVYAFLYRKRSASRNVGESEHIKQEEELDRAALGTDPPLGPAKQELEGLAIFELEGDHPIDEEDGKRAPKLERRSGEIK